MTVTLPPVRTPLKWCGGKRQLLPELQKALPKGGVRGHYFEPFVGGGALFFALSAAGFEGPVTLGDMNERLVRTYLGIQYDVWRVIAMLEKMKYRKAEYLKRRRENTENMDDAETAAWFIYLNRCCFNGIWRVNKKGEFNVPFGRYVNPTICDEDGLKAAHVALGRARVVCSDFSAAVEDAGPGDVVYFDPPYVPVSTTADFTSYTKEGFTLTDQERLRDVSLHLKKRGCHVILSNSDCKVVRKLYEGFTIRRVSARRNVNSKADRREAVGELIIT